MIVSKETVETIHRALDLAEIVPEMVAALENARQRIADGAAEGFNLSLIHI